DRRLKLDGAHTMLKRVWRERGNLDDIPYLQSHHVGKGVHSLACRLFPCMNVGRDALQPPLQPLRINRFIKANTLFHSETVDSFINNPAQRLIFSDRLKKCTAKRLIVAVFSTHLRIETIANG